jgi:hypothetical protein
LGRPQVCSIESRRELQQRGVAPRSHIVENGARAPLDRSVEQA